MNDSIFPTVQIEIDEIINQYDLLNHPFYQTWSLGKLCRSEIAEYAIHCYHHVAAFPRYLELFEHRLPDGALKDLVGEHKRDEKGEGTCGARSHSELWLDFAEGMGADRFEVTRSEPINEVRMLIEHFTKTCISGSAAEVLSAYYTYESQVARIAAEKERGLLSLYGVDKQTAYYFTLHKAFDIVHSQDWIKCLYEQICNKQHRSAALKSAERTVNALWKALDGIERERLAA